MHIGKVPLKKNLPLLDRLIKPNVGRLIDRARNEELTLPELNRAVAWLGAHPDDTNLRQLESLFPVIYSGSYSNAMKNLARTGQEILGLQQAPETERTTSETLPITHSSPVAPPVTPAQVVPVEVTSESTPQPVAQPVAPINPEISKSRELAPETTRSLVSLSQPVLLEVRAARPSVNATREKENVDLQPVTSQAKPDHDSLLSCLGVCRDKLDEIVNLVADETIRSKINDLKVKIETANQDTKKCDGNGWLGVPISIQLLLAKICSSTYRINWEEKSKLSKTQQEILKNVYELIEKHLYEHFGVEHFFPRLGDEYKLKVHEIEGSVPNRQGIFVVTAVLVPGYRYRNVEGALITKAVVTVGLLI